MQYLKENIPRVLAGFFMWVVLAGFLVLPGSYYPEIEEILEKSGELRKVLKYIQNVPL